MDPENTETLPSENAPAQETVALHEASNEDVKAALEDRIKQEEQESSREAGNLDLATPDLDSNSTPKPTEAEVAPQAPSNVAPVGAAPSATAQATPATSQPELGNQKELLIRTRRSELGQMQAQISSQREQLLQAKAQLEENLREVFREDPYEGMQRQNRLAQINDHLQTLDAREAQAVQIVESQSLFLAHIGDDPQIINSAAEMLRVEGIPENFVQQFAQNPWTFTSPEGLVEIGKRAKLYNEFKTADSDRNLLARHVLHLNKELEKYKARGQSTVNQIQKNLNQSPSVTAKGSGGAPRASVMNPNAVAAMSDAEVKQALQKAMQQEQAH